MNNKIQRVLKNIKKECIASKIIPEGCCDINQQFIADVFSPDMYYGDIIDWTIRYSIDDSEDFDNELFDAMISLFMKVYNNKNYHKIDCNERFIKWHFLYIKQCCPALMNSYNDNSANYMEFLKLCFQELKNE